MHGSALRATRDVGRRRDARVMVGPVKDGRPAGTRDTPSAPGVNGEGVAEESDLWPEIRATTP